MPRQKTNVPRWIEGPPPGAGRFWVVWRGWPDGTRVEAIELSPALIHRGDPAAPLLIKTLTGLAFRFSAYRSEMTHHMPLLEPASPAEGAPR